MSESYIFRQISARFNDPYKEYALDRDSLPDLNEIIRQLNDTGSPDAATVALFVADPVEIANFVDTIFCHAENGYVQLRMFVDGEKKKPWGWSTELRGWPAVEVKRRDDLIYTAIGIASKAARAPEKVNFCPPVATFIGPHRATINDLCESVALMVECDEKPQEARQGIETLLGSPTIVVRSGGVYVDPVTQERQDKIHVYWRLAVPARDPAGHAKVAAARDLMARIVSSDPTAKPSVHPLRWPGSWHKKGEPRLCRIIEINAEVEVDLDTALTVLREAVPLPLTEREAKPRPVDEPKPKTTSSTTSSGDATTEPRQYVRLAGATWDAERDSGHLLQQYRSLTSNRHYQLSCYAVKIAMSALNTGYKIEFGELAILLATLQSQNPPENRYNDPELWRIAKEGIEKAIDHVGDDPAYLRRDKRLAEEWERIRHDIEDMNDQSDTNMYSTFDDYEQLDDEDDIFTNDKADKSSGSATADKTQNPNRIRVYFDEYKEMPDIAYWDDAKLMPRKPDGTTALVLGKFGSHKTNCALSMCMDAVVNHGAKAIYVACEGAYGIGKLRVPAHCDAHGIGVEELRCRFEFMPQGINLTDPNDVAKFIQGNMDFMPDIVVVDTLAQATPNVDSNSSFKGDIFGNSGPVALIRRVFNCLVLVLCHPPKNNPNEILGHTSIAGNTDMILLVEFNRENSPPITVTCKRNKDGPEGSVVYYEIESEGVPVPRRVEVEDGFERRLGLQKRNFEADLASFVSIACHEENATDYESGLTIKQVAEKLTSRVTAVGELSDAEYKKRVDSKAKQLLNALRKHGHGSQFDHLAQKAAPNGSKKEEWRFFKSPRTAESHAEWMAKIMGKMRDHQNSSQADGSP